MLIAIEEYQALERRIDLEWRDWQRDHDKYGDLHGDLRSPATQFLLKNPHLFLLLDYDDYRVLRRTKTNIQLVEDYVGPSAAFALSKESIFRESTSGRWALFQGLIPHKWSRDKAQRTNPLQCHFVGPDGRYRFFSVEDFLLRVKHAASKPHDSSKSIVLPSAWLPAAQTLQKIQLFDAAQSIVQTLNAAGGGLSDLSWRTLEEVVAELLRGMGLEIHLTPASKDGGRDIIARGELIPGEPLLMSVEVKQKKVVGLHDVQRALYANRHFPGLMITTSGSFSAGVVAEKCRPENHMRLFLKDGVALQQWLRAYARRNRPPSQNGLIG